MTYHVKISPSAERDIRAIGKAFRRGIAYAVRSVLADPSADDQYFDIGGPLRGVVVGNMVAVFRFMTPEELKELDVPGRYVIRVAHQDELEEVATELEHELASLATPVMVAAEDLLRALRAAVRRRLP